MDSIFLKIQQIFPNYLITSKIHSLEGNLFVTNVKNNREIDMFSSWYLQACSERRVCG